MIHIGDCLQLMRGMADASVDAIVTDPPYGLSFMGKRWTVMCRASRSGWSASDC
jgi:DNA modification methylase